MKKKVLNVFIALFFVFSFSVTNVSALVPSNPWGFSVGDVLYYNASIAESSIEGTVKLNITSIQNGTLSIGGGDIDLNYVNFTISFNLFGAWIPIMQSNISSMVLTGYNETLGEWLGLVMYYGIPAPIPVISGFNMTNVNETLYPVLFVEGWSNFNTTLTSDQLTYFNSTDSFEVKFNMTSGICTNLTRTQGNTTEFSYSYLGDEDPFPPITIPEVPYNEVFMIAVVGITILVVLILIDKIRKRE
ncbi:MAG: hypothetical protein ACTSUV_04895 [Candidatus Ranarchaeia archaeon]